MNYELITALQRLQGDHGAYTVIPDLKFRDIETCLRSIEEAKKLIELIQETMEEAT
jgi:hypothetical protein